MSSADTEAPSTEETEEAVESDEVREALLAEITELIADDLVESHIEPDRELFLRVKPESWKQVHKTLRDYAGFKFFEFLSAIDWMPSPFGKSEDSSVDAGSLVTMVEAPGEPEPGYAGGDGRFQVFTRLIDVTRDDSLAVVIKVDVEDMGELETLIGVFPGANWHEREIHEMFGISFAGHPYLAKLYLPTGFEGHPLRKDYPLLARHVKPWPGIVDVEPMPDEADDASGAESESEGGGES